MTVSSDAALLLVTVPDEAVAAAIAGLVDDGLVASVQRQPIRSRYRWAGAVHARDELLLTIAVAQADIAAVTEQIRARHPYEVPQIVAVPIAWGWPAYLQWVASRGQETSCESDA